MNRVTGSYLSQIYLFVLDSFNFYYFKSVCFFQLISVKEQCLKEKIFHKSALKLFVVRQTLNSNCKNRDSLDNSYNFFPFYSIILTLK